jgi:hypothetical protein
MQDQMPFSESFILGIIGAIGGLITLIFASLRKSRCNSINCCCGFFICNRDVMDAEEMAIDAKPISPKAVQQV